MNNWLITVSCLSVLLLAYLLWKEIYRKDRSRLIWRMAATFFSVGSLLCFTLPLTWHKSNTDPVRHAILLTEGFNTDSLRNFLSRTKSNLPVYTLDEMLLPAEKYNARLIADPGSALLNDAAALHIFGYGLNAEELAGIKNPTIIFHSSPISGIISVHWPSLIKNGEIFYLQGRYNNTTSSTIKIALSSFDIKLDEVTIPANQNQVFQLTTSPKHAGRSVYQLSVIQHGDTIEKAPVPVKISESAPVKIFMLASSPDFDNKFLKNWLAEKGFEIVVKTIISKDKSDKAFYNTAATNLDRITPFLLQNVDVIIADASAIASLNQQESRALQDFVMEKSKGLIVKADNAINQALFFAHRFPLISYPSTAQQTFYPRLNDTASKLQPLTMESPVFIRASDGTHSLVRDNQERVFVNSTVYGSGKIIMTTLSNTFSWTLSGYQETYTQLWSTILNNALNPLTEQESWHTTPALPRLHLPVSVYLQTNIGGVPSAEVEGASVYLKNNPNLPFSWSGSFWPVNEGWQRIVQLNGAIHYWYVFGKHDWKNVEAFHKNQLTQKFSDDQSNMPPSKKRSTSVEEPVPTIIFFLIFLVCTGFIWLENKYQHSGL